MNHLVKLGAATLMTVLSGLFLVGCGIVDEEGAQATLDIKKQILEIQVGELDPLMDQITELQKTIDPLEREIEDMEEEREDLYEQGRQLGDEFEDEMRKKFDVLFMQKDEGREKFEEEIQQEFKVFEDRRRELERSQKDVWNELDKEMEEARRELEGSQKGVWDEFERSQKDVWDELDKETKTMWRNWEQESEEMRAAKEKESEETRHTLEDELQARKDAAQKGSPELNERRDALEAEYEGLKSEQREFLIDFYHKCFYCEKPLSEGEDVIHIDHLIPFAYVYETELHNCVPACVDCNLFKSKRLPLKLFFNKKIEDNEKMNIRNFCEGYQTELYQEDYDLCLKHFHRESPRWPQEFGQMDKENYNINHVQEFLKRHNNSQQ